MLWSCGARASGCRKIRLGWGRSAESCGRTVRSWPPRNKIALTGPGAGRRRGRWARGRALSERQVRAVPLQDSRARATQGRRGVSRYRPDREERGLLPSPGDTSELALSAGPNGSRRSPRIAVPLRTLRTVGHRRPPCPRGSPAGSAPPAASTPDSAKEGRRHSGLGGTVATVFVDARCLRRRCAPPASARARRSIAPTVSRTTGESRTRYGASRSATTPPQGLCPRRHDSKD
jgi:hypothetical protein